MIKSGPKLAYVHTIISPNNLRACSENNHVRAIKNRKTWVFWSGSSKRTSTSPCNNSHSNQSRLMNTATDMLAPGWKLAKRELESRAVKRTETQAAEKISAESRTLVRKSEACERKIGHGDKTTHGRWTQARVGALSMKENPLTHRKRERQREYASRTCAGRIHTSAQELKVEKPPGKRTVGNSKGT
jgi:hypothetical protein